MRTGELVGLVSADGDLDRAVDGVSGPEPALAPAAAAVHDLGRLDAHISCNTAGLVRL